METRSEKIVVLGFDGADYFLMKQLMEAGALPNFSRLAAKGVFAPLRSTIPHHSGPAWTTFATGAHPGTTGIFSFFLPPESYSQKPAFSTDIKVPSFWDIASLAGVRCGVLGVPLTHPPQPVNGIMVSGYPARDESEAYPENAHKKIYDETPAEAPMTKTVFDAAEWIRFLYMKDIRRARLIPRLMKEFDLQILTAVFEMTDQVQHYYWHDFDLQHPNHDPDTPHEIQEFIPRTYMTADALTGRIMDEVGEDANYFIVSDHGFGPMDKVYNILFAFQNIGLLKVKDPTALNEALSKGSNDMNDLLDIEHSFVYFTHMGLTFATGINLNLAGREPRGIVPPGDGEKLLTNIKTLLEAEIDPETGAHVFTQVSHKEEIYSGPCLDNAPDLLALSNYKIVTTPTCNAKFNSIKVPAFGESRNHLNWTGTHRVNGVFIAAGPSIGKCNNEIKPSIADVAPTILKIAGIKKPDYMDGSIIHILKNSVINYPAVYVAPGKYVEDADSCHPAPPLTEEDKQNAIDRLRGMGYI